MSGKYIFRRYGYDESGNASADSRYHWIGPPSIRGSFLLGRAADAARYACPPAVGDAEDDITIGNLFYGTKGWMHVNGGTWKTYFGRKNEPGPGSESNDVEADPMNLAGTGGGGHVGNFITAVRSGKRSDLTCDIEEGFKSSILPLLANASYRVGESLEFDGKSETFKGHRQANQMIKDTGRKPYTIPNHV